MVVVEHGMLLKIYVYMYGILKRSFSLVLFGLVVFLISSCNDDDDQKSSKYYVFDGTEQQLIYGLVASTPDTGTDEDGNPYYMYEISFTNIRYSDSESTDPRSYIVFLVKSPTPILTPGKYSFLKDTGAGRIHLASYSLDYSWNKPDGFSGLTCTLTNGELEITQSGTMMYQIKFKGTAVNDLNADNKKAFNLYYIQTAADF